MPFIPVTTVLAVPHTVCDGLRRPSEILRPCVTDSTPVGDVAPIIRGTSPVSVRVDTPLSEEAAVPHHAPPTTLVTGRHSRALPAPPAGDHAAQAHWTSCRVLEEAP